MPSPSLPPTGIAIAVFTAFGTSTSSLIAASGTLAESPPADATAMMMGIKTVVALVAFTVVSTFGIAGIYFGLIFALRSERNARRALEQRVRKLEGKPPSDDRGDE